jgi:MFS superfamily sulfate permease-like transporter
MSNVFLAGIVLVTLAIFAPAFQWLPETVLAAVVINAMWGSANPRGLERLWRIDKVDFALAGITFFLVLALDLLPAMVAGIILSIVYMIYRVSFSGRELLGRVPETGDYEVRRWLHGRRHGEAHPEAEPAPGVIVYRFSAPLSLLQRRRFQQHR